MQSVDLARDAFALVDVHILAWVGPQRGPREDPERTQRGPREDPGRTQRTLYMVRRRGRGFIRMVGMLLVVVDVVVLLLVINQIIVPLQISFFASPHLVIFSGHPVLWNLPLVLCSSVLEPNFHLEKEKVFRKVRVKKRVDFGWNGETIALKRLT